MGNTYSPVITTERYTSGTDLWDADTAYVSGDSLLITGPRGGEIWSIADLKPVKLSREENRKSLPCWAGPDGTGIGRVQSMFDMNTGRKIGSLALMGVPEEYEWSEHTFRYHNPYIILSSNLAAHVGRSLTIHSLPGGEMLDEFALARDDERSIVGRFIALAK